MQMDITKGAIFLLHAMQGVQPPEIVGKVKV